MSKWYKQNTIISHVWPEFLHVYVYIDGFFIFGTLNQPELIKLFFFYWFLYWTCTSKFNYPSNIFWIILMLIKISKENNIKIRKTLSQWQFSANTDAKVQGICNQEHQICLMRLENLAEYMLTMHIRTTVGSSQSLRSRIL